MWTAARAPTGCVNSCSHAASSCPKARRTTRSDAPTVNGVGNRKNELVLKIIDERGVNPYPGSIRYLEAVKAAGLRIAVVTSSANGAKVLDAGDLSKYVEARVDGLTIRERNLKGKPAPDSFLAGAEALGVEPAHAAVFEDAQSGVQAGKAGELRVRRRASTGPTRPTELRAHGADVVVDDLAELLEDR